MPSMRLAQLLQVEWVHPDQYISPDILMERRLRFFVLWQVERCLPIESPPSPDFSYQLFLVVVVPTLPCPIPDLSTGRSCLIVGHVGV
jgi:hypothetical protein